MSSITQIKPKRTPNAFMLFLNKNRSQIKAGLIAVGIDANKAKFVAKTAGAQWKQMSTEEKQPYIDESNTLKDEAQAEANRLNAEAEAAALANTTPEPVSIPTVVHTKETNTEETFNIFNAKFHEQLDDAYQIIDDLRKHLAKKIWKVSLLQSHNNELSEHIKKIQKSMARWRDTLLQQEEEKEKVAETEINSAKLRLSHNATSEERKALHLLQKSEELYLVLMLDDDTYHVSIENDIP